MTAGNDQHEFGDNLPVHLFDPALVKTKSSAVSIDLIMKHADRAFAGQQGAPEHALATDEIESLVSMRCQVWIGGMDDIMDQGLGPSQNIIVLQRKNLVHEKDQNFKKRKANVSF